MIDLTSVRVTLGKSGGRDGTFTITLDDAASGRIIGEVSVPAEQAANLFGNAVARGSMRLYSDTTENIAVLGRQQSHTTEPVPAEHTGHRDLAGKSRRDPKVAEAWAVAHAWAEARGAELGADSVSVDTRRTGDGIGREVYARFDFYGEPVGRAEPEEG